MLRRGWRNVFYTVLLLAGAAHAQAWKPLKHVELVSGSAAGAASDGVLRAVERLLQEKKLVEVTTAVVNKPGGGGAIGWTYLSQQPPDGHHLTLLIGNLVSGHIDLVANPHSSFAAPLKEGRVRVLAVAAPQRLGGDFASVPTWKELGIDSSIEAFRAIAGPKNMGAAQVAFWEGTLRKMVDTPEWKQLLENRSWVDRFAGAEGCKAAFKVQYEQMHIGLQELGLAKR